MTADLAAPHFWGNWDGDGGGYNLLLKGILDPFTCPFSNQLGSRSLQDFHLEFGDRCYLLKIIVKSDQRCPVVFGDHRNQKVK